MMNLNNNCSNQHHQHTSSILTPNIIYWNCHSLHRSYILLTTFLHQHNNNIDIIALVETWPAVYQSQSNKSNAPHSSSSPSSSFHLNIPHYTYIETVDTINNINDKNTFKQNSGGIGFYIHDRITYTNDITFLCTKTSSSTQIHTISITSPYKLDVICCYIQPTATKTDIDTAQNTLQKIHHLHSPYVVVGDFNHSSSLISTINNCSTNINQMLHPYTNTYHKGLYNSILDLCFASDSSTITDLHITNETVLQSDHSIFMITLSPYILKLAFNSSASTSTSTRPIWYIPKPTQHDLHTIITPNYQRLLTYTLQDWYDTHQHTLSCTSQQQLDNIYDTLIANICEAATTIFKHNTSLSPRTQQQQQQQQRQQDQYYWFHDPDIIQLVHTLRTAKTIQRNQPSLLHQQHVHILQKELKILQGIKRKQYWETFVSKLEDEQKAICWSLWRKSKGNMNPSKLNNIFNSNNQPPQNITQSLNNLCSHYASISSNSTHAPTIDTPYDNIIPYDNSTPFFSLKTVTSALAHIQLDTALGSDQIHPALLKYSVPIDYKDKSSSSSSPSSSITLASCLTLFFNIMWNSHYIPTIWTQSDVISLFKPKKGNQKTNAASYRPISLTSVICRMFERIVKDTLIPFITPTLSMFQHGFMNQKSTNDCLYILTSKIQQAFSRKALLPIAFIDFSNAFDTISHNDLLDKLKTQFNTIPPHMFNFFKSFLSNRLIRTKYLHYFSNWFPISAGVPQGSVLGPIFFLLYINDLSDILFTMTGVIPQFFADDLCIIPNYMIKPLASSVNQQLNHALNELYKWSAKFKMKINYNKSNIVLFHSTYSISTYKRLLPVHIYTIHNTILENVDSYKYLGMILHKHLHWNLHFEDVVFRAERAVHLVTRTITAHSSIHITTQLVNMTIRPIIAYALPFWTPTELQFNKLNGIVSYALKRALGLPISAHTLTVLTERAIPDVRLWQQQLILSFFHRISHLPPDSHLVYTCHQLQLNTLIYNINTHFLTATKDTRSQTKRLQSPRIINFPKSNHSKTVRDKSIPLVALTSLHTTDIPSTHTSFPIYPATITQLSTISSLLLKKQTQILAHTTWLRSEDKGGKRVKQYHQQHQINTLTCALYHYYDTTSSSRLRARLLHDRAQLNQKRFEWFSNKNNSLSPLCLHCRMMETTEHTLLYCKRFSAYRHTLRTALASSPLFITTPLSVSRIITPTSNLISSPILLKRFFLITSNYLEQIAALHPY
jgi:hypothetical protein